VGLGILLGSLILDFSYSLLLLLDVSNDGAAKDSLGTIPRGGISRDKRAPFIVSFWCKLRYLHMGAILTIEIAFTVGWLVFQDASIYIALESETKNDLNTSLSINHPSETSFRDKIVTELQVPKRTLPRI